MVLPTVTAVSPISGSFFGGQTVTLTGTGFSVSTPTVFFGTVAGTSVVVGSDTSLTVTSPAAIPTADAQVFITVTTTAGTSLSSDSAVYYYINLLSSPSYSVNNSYFDPLANYVVFGQWTFVLSPVLPAFASINVVNLTVSGSTSLNGGVSMSALIAAAGSNGGAMTHQPPSGYDFVVQNTTTKALAYWVPA